MRRADLLDEAKRLTVGRRDEDYGSPGANFLMASKMISAYLGWDIKKEDVAVLQMILKICRLKTSPQKADNWIDIAGYAACGSEVAQAKYKKLETDKKPLEDTQETR